jgi:hypothetical protein
MGFCELQVMPMAGKINSAMELRINTTPSATETCFSSAWITGAIAAMALPPANGRFRRK